MLPDYLFIYSFILLLLLLLLFIFIFIFYFVYLRMISMSSHQCNIFGTHVSRHTKCILEGDGNEPWSLSCRSSILTTEHTPHGHLGLCWIEVNLLMANCHFNPIRTWPLEHLSHAHSYVSRGNSITTGDYSFEQIHWS